jgi:CBS domain-containing protein
VRAALEEAAQSGHHGFPVVETVGGRPCMSGFITFRDLKQLVEEGNGDVSLGEVAIRDVIHAHPDHTLDRVMLKLGQEELSLLPVVSRTDPMRLVGVISMRDVVRAQARLTQDDSKPNGKKSR